MEGSQGPCQGSAYRPGLSVYTIAGMRNKSPGRPPLNVRLMCSPSFLNKAMLLVIQKKTFTFYIYLVCTKLSLGEKAHRISSVESVGLGPEARICQPDAFGFQKVLSIMNFSIR